MKKQLEQLKIFNATPSIKDKAFIINLDGYESIAALWIALYFNNIDVTYFDSFEVEYIPKEI